MIYLIIAQLARGAVIWTTSHLGRKILKTIVVGSITLYLVERVKKQNIIDENRGYAVNEKPGRASS